MNEKFFRGYYLFRIICVAAVIGFAVLGMIKCHSHTVDIEFRGPEWDRIDQGTRDRDNREAAERCNERERNNETPDRRDVERALEYERDHGV